MKDITMTTSELHMISNPETFKVINSSEKKIEEGMKNVKSELESYCTQNCAQYLDAPFQHGRTYRGNNHHGFPWNAVDFPKRIDGNDIFLFRTLFLWGHHFGIYLILTGKFAVRESIVALTNELRNSELPYEVAIHGDLWNWFHPSEDWVPLKTWNDRGILTHHRENPAFKMAVFLPPEKYSVVAETSVKIWSDIALRIHPSISS